MKNRRNAILTVVLSASFVGGIHAASAYEADGARSIQLSFSDGRPAVKGVHAVNEHLLQVGVRVSEVEVPNASRSLIAQSRTRALKADEQGELLRIFSLDRKALLNEVAQAGRRPAVEGGGALSISEKNVPPYPKLYDMKALDQKTVAFLMSKFGKLHVNSSESGEGIDEVMTIISGGPFTWFFALHDGTVGKVRFSTVDDGDKAWRISYPGKGVHGGYFDAPHGLVVAHAHGPQTFVMRYEDATAKSSNLLNDNPWIDFSAKPPQLLDRPREQIR